MSDNDMIRRGDALDCFIGLDCIVDIMDAIASLPAITPATSPGVTAGAVGTYQDRVDAWMDACFGASIKADRLERCDRFIEEALELVQTEQAFTADRAHALVDYVFGRDVGDPRQEVGGVMVTLAALCNTLDIGIEDAAETELARVWTKVEAIRAKQAAKPKGSALPVATPPTALDDPRVRKLVEAAEYCRDSGEKQKRGIQHPVMIVDAKAWANLCAALRAIAEGK